MNNYIEQFNHKMKAAGLNPPPDLIADGEIHRFSTNLRINDNAGWYVLHSDGIPAGAFGDWRTGQVTSLCANLDEKMTFEDWRKHRRIMDNVFRLRKDARALEQQDAAKRAVIVWSQGKPASPRAFHCSQMWPIINLTYHRF